MNPWPQDGSRRQNHGTMESAPGTFNFYITSPDILLLLRYFSVKCIRQALPIELEKSKTYVGSYKEKLELPPCGSLFSQLSMNELADDCIRTRVLLC